jgi:NosR/NirI family nitrous oxide reductase transcriptional regulator
VLLLRAVQEQRDAADALLTVAQVRDFFPAAERLEAADAAGRQEVRAADGTLLGRVTTTLPESKRIIGYSGPTHSLIAFDPQGRILGLRVLRSHDTPDHLAEVVADRAFFRQFTGRKPGEVPGLELHTVTGATLTSTAIAEGVLARLGAAAQVSLRFPEEITLEEVRQLEPAAESLRENRGPVGGWQVLDKQGGCLGIAVRSSPVTDAVVGYKGPTDTLLLLDADGRALRGLAVRKSYDTGRYVGYVTGDRHFLKLFNGRSLEELAALDFREAKIEGVSGATETSWAIAEGLKQRAADLLSRRPAGWLRQIRWRWQDTGHVLMIVSALLMAFTRLRGVVWLRHLHHAGLVVYGGFIAGELLSQGLFAGWGAHGSPWRSAPGLLLLAVVALLAPVFSGRQLYCHHLCAHGALQQLLARRLRWQLRLSARVDRWLGRLPFALLGLILASVVLGWGIDINALEPFDAYLFRVAGWASLSLAVFGLVAALFTPLAYCRYGCPTGALFKLLRVAGAGDHLGWRDLLAALALASAALAI